MSAGPLTPDDLRETCPACQGTGLDPDSRAAQDSGGPGRQIIFTSQAKCSNRLCRDGKIPSAIGMAILKLRKDYEGVVVH
jgi:hypothetical protein